MADIKKTAVTYFDAYPKEDAFHVTTDGQFFPEKRKSDAHAHEKTLKEGKGKVQFIERKEVADLLKKEGASSGDEVLMPEGEPTKDWKVDQIKAYMESKSIDAGEAKTKAELLAAIEAAVPAE